MPGQWPPVAFVPRIDGEVLSDPVVQDQPVLRGIEFRDGQVDREPLILKCNSDIFSSSEGWKKIKILKNKTNMM
jgi:hypothetical protein